MSFNINDIIEIDIFFSTRVKYLNIILMKILSAKQLRLYLKIRVYISWSE